MYVFSTGWEESIELYVGQPCGESRWGVSKKMLLGEFNWIQWGAAGNDSHPSQEAGCA